MANPKNGPILVSTVNGDLAVIIRPYGVVGTLAIFEGPMACGKSVSRRAVEQALRDRGYAIKISEHMRENGRWIMADRLVVEGADSHTVRDIFQDVGMSALREAGLVEAPQEA